MVDVGYQRKRRGQLGIRADLPSVHSPQQRVQRDRARTKLVRANLYGIVGGVAQICVGGKLDGCRQYKHVQSTICGHR